MPRNTIRRQCIECKLCVKECAFLQKHGDPKSIAEAFDPARAACSALPFECNMCALCSAVCPVDLQPPGMFLQMRRDILNEKGSLRREHSRILGYEKRGTSKRYSLYALPKGCDTVLFPGCTLSGARPERVMGLFEHIRKSLPSLGIVLDCCTKPSHDLGREEYFKAMFGEMKACLFQNGVRNVLLACPSCFQIFKEHGQEFTSSTVYKFLAEKGLPDTGSISGIFSVQDSCTTRFETRLQDAVRILAREKGLTIEEMPHSREKTFCCGEGGAACFVSPALSGNWPRLRKEEANGRRLIAYCAGCVSRLNPVTPTTHLLDILFEPNDALSGKVKVSGWPITYWNRIRLKRRFRKLLAGATMRERQ
ncbi:MAG: 4Fe-4S dicluster domain-containing protein [Syntrophobacteraceae bacterium]